MPKPVEAIVEEMVNGKGEQADPRLGDLIEDLEGYFLKYISFPDPSLATLCALWIAQTACYQNFSYCGYLALRSSTPGCGKTRLLSLISLFTPGQPDVMANPTGAVLFRIGQRPLILDEVDRLRDKDKDTHGDVLAILDKGFEKGGCVWRCVGKSHDVKSFPVYSPKAIAGIERLADTLAARSFQIHLKRTKKRMPRLLIRRLEDKARHLRNNLLVWAEDNQARMIQAYEHLPETIKGLSHYDDRFVDLSEPLFVLASLADFERSDEPCLVPKLKKALQVAVAKRQPTGREEALQAFLDLADELLHGVTEHFVSSQDLVEALKDHDELGWIDSKRKLSNFLKEFELYSKPKGGKVRGYVLSMDWVAEWRERYPQNQDEAESI